MDASQAAKATSEPFWHVVAVTSQSELAADQVSQALRIEQKAGRLSIGELLTVIDPAPCIGSGGATLNALYCVTEHLSAVNGLSTLSADVALVNRNILLLHVGSGSRPYLFDACGRHAVMVPSGGHEVPDARKNTVSSENTSGESVSLVSDSWAPLAVHCVRQLTQFCCASASRAGDEEESDACPPGVWVCGTEFYLRLSRPMSWRELVACEPPEVLTVAGLCSSDEAKQHGVLALDPSSGHVSRVVYRPSVEALDGLEICGGSKSGDTAPSKFARVSGPYYFPPAVASAMVGLHTAAPLHGCIYDGIDSGAPPIYLSLVFDLIAAFCPSPAPPVNVANTVEAALCQSRCLGDTKTLAALTAAEAADRTDAASRQLRERLGGFRNRLVLLQAAEFCYLGNEPSEYFRLLELNYSPSEQPCWKFHCADAVDAYHPERAPEGLLVAAAGFEFEQQHEALLKRLLKPPVDCYLACVRIRSSDAAETNSVVYIGTARTDNLLQPVAPGTQDWQVLGQPVEAFSRRTGLAIEADLFDGCQSNELRRCLWHCRLFPARGASDQEKLQVLAWLLNCADSSHAEDSAAAAIWRRCQRLSMAEIVANSDAEAELAHRRRVAKSSLVKSLSNTLTGSSACTSSRSGLRSLFELAVAHGLDGPLLPALDSLALRVASTAAEPGGNCSRDSGLARAGAACVLAAIGLLLGTKAGGRGGLHSGPADNRLWSGALSHIASGRLAEGLAGMADLRAAWAGRPDLLMRAARHYERAGQLLVSGAVRASCLDGDAFATSAPNSAVAAASTEVPASLRPPVIPGRGVTAICPARVDLSGGWSDTPPICWEFGGAVANLAVLVNGRKPIGCRVEAFDLQLMAEAGDEANSSVAVVELVNADCNGAVVGLRSLADLADCSRPLVPGALAKCCLIVSGLFSVEQPDATGGLREQVARLCGADNCGIRVTAWSGLPAGSGLGTSSILAGAILAALLRWAGLAVDLDALVRGVLAVEQLLSTGGGWQDQVGGLFPGLKLARSPQGLPLRVQVTQVETPPGFLDRLDSSLVLLYTGTTRLARNLLQEAVRAWHCRDASVVSIISGLVDDAEACAAAAEIGDLSTMCDCVRRYRRRKSAMAPGSETVQLGALLDRLEAEAAGLAEESSAALLCGAGGGGFLAALLPPAARNRLLTLAASDSILPDSGGARLHSVRVARDGLEFVED